MNKKGYLTNTQNLNFESSKLLNEIDWFELKQDNNEQDPVKKFKTKTDKLIHSDFVVADLNNLTTETAMELGIIYGIAYSKAVMDEMFSNTDYELQNQIKFLAKKHGLKDRDIYCLNSNKEILNKYVEGGLTCLDTFFANSMGEIEKECVNDLEYLNLISKYTSIEENMYILSDNEDEETLALSIYGYITSLESKKIQTAIMMIGELSNEVFPTKAK